MTVDLAALPPTPTDADPVIVPGLIASIEAGLIELDDTFLGETNA